MTSKTGLLALAALALAACAADDSTAPAPSGGSAGAMGEAYCETTPSDPAEIENWEQICMPDEGGR
jgi:hypothetical protein